MMQPQRFRTARPKGLAAGLLAMLVSGVGAADRPPPLIWQYDLLAPSFGSAAVGDIDNDGRPELAFG